MNDLNAIVPIQYQVYVIVGGIAIKYIAELYSAVRAGGGLRRIIMTFWFGEQVAPVIAADYKVELNTSKPTIIPLP